MTIIIYLGVSNVSGTYLWCKAAYKGLECYAGTCSYEYVSPLEYCGIHKKGLKGFFKSFLDPIPVMLPMNIMEVLIRPTAPLFPTFW